jgi:hypothetical protein
VEWSNASVPYNNRVWVWIDFCPISGTVPATSFSTATVSSSTKTGGNGMITGVTARGFFIEYASTTNAGTTVTATLDNAPAGKFNWCAYGSDYPPNAVIIAGGGYTLRGTKPFAVNGSQVDATSFGAGTCVETITDLTGRPDGFASPKPTLSNPNSPSRCAEGAVTLSATVSGGTTSAMTYTWTVGGTPYTTTTNSYTTGSLSASAAYTVKVKNANNCESATASGNITVRYAGQIGQTPDATCGCAGGTIVCGYSCKSSCEATFKNPCVGDIDSQTDMSWQECAYTCAVRGFAYFRIRQNPNYASTICSCCN